MCGCVVCEEQGPHAEGAHGQRGPGRLALDERGPARIRIERQDAESLGRAFLQGGQLRRDARREHKPAMGACSRRRRRAERARRRQQGRPRVHTLHSPLSALSALSHYVCTTLLCVVYGVLCVALVTFYCSTCSLVALCRVPHSAYH